MNKRTTKRNLLLIAFGVTLYSCLANLGQIAGYIRGFVYAFAPILGGLLAAFILNVPARAVDRLLNRLFRKKRLKENVLWSASVILTFLLIALLLYLICTLIIPELVASVGTIYAVVTKKLPEWIQTLRQHGVLTEYMTHYSADLTNILYQLANYAGPAINSILGAAISTVSGVASVGIGAIIAMYALIEKNTLKRQAERLLSAYLPERAYRSLIHVSSMICVTYDNFFSGQCLEAGILGGLMAMMFYLFRLPYAGIVGVMTAVGSFIPFIGDFIVVIASAILTLLTEPSRVLLCVVVFHAVQFVENQLIYPHVVGSSVGLSPFWTLIAVLIGGKLLGVFGMIFFIPLAAVISSLLKEDAVRRTAHKKTDLSGRQQDNSSTPETEL